MRHAAVFVLASAFVVFCIVQDRVTAAGARLYVQQQRAALAGRGGAPTIDEVMRPAVRRSVARASLGSGLVLVTGLGGIGLVSRRRRRE